MASCNGEPEVELLQGVKAKWSKEPSSGEEEGELVEEDGQGALRMQPGGRAPAKLRARVGREEHGRRILSIYLSIILDTRVFEERVLYEYFLGNTRRLFFVISCCYKSFFYTFFI